MSKTAVITLSSREPREPYYYHRQFQESARRQGITPIYLNERIYAGLMTKPKSLQSWLEKNGDNYDHICSVDAWDIIWTAPMDEVMEKYHSFDAPIVFNAERNCFPRADLADKHPESPTPYRFLNSGFFIGETNSVIDMLHGMHLENVPDDKLPDGTVVNTNDQAIYMAWYVDHLECATLDKEALICQSLHGSGDDEFEFLNGRVFSKLTGSAPSVFHGNGSGKAWLRKVMEWMNI